LAAASSHKFFIPGWGAPACLYDPGLPPEWKALEPPSFRASGGSFNACRDWFATEIARLDEPVVLAGHSMGAALAMAVAADVPDRVSGLLLIAPAGLPLTKPIRRSMASFASQLAHGRYPMTHAARAAARIASAPRSALKLAFRVRDLDLSPEMRRIRRQRIPVTVVGCLTDTLVTVPQCREAARLLGAAYRELDLPGGHMWMLDSWRTLRGELRLAGSPVPMKA